MTPAAMYFLWGQGRYVKKKNRGYKNNARGFHKKEMENNYI